MAEVGQGGNCAAAETVVGVCRDAGAHASIIDREVSSACSMGPAGRSLAPCVLGTCASGTELGGATVAASA